MTEGFDLSARNTFRMKVSCARFVEYNSSKELHEINFVELTQPVFHIGGGSNILFTKDFPGTILHSCIKEFRVASSSNEGVLVEVGAGMPFDDLCSWAANNGLWGPENLSGIPGEVGAAAVQNIGAYGVEACEIISAVKCFDTVTREDVAFNVASCAYAYRDSAFKHEPYKGRYIITSVLFSLSREYSPRLGYKQLAGELGSAEDLTPARVRETVLRIRSSKLPDPAEIGSAGSFFKNPVVSGAEYQRICALAEAEGLGEVPHYPSPQGVKLSAAWMIDRCSLKGRSIGGAAVYERQPLVIVNRSGEATPEDVLAVEKLVCDSVLERFGVQLHPEVEHL